LKFMTDDLIKLRHQLHSHPELSGKEANTAHLIKSFLELYYPDSIVTDLGGSGLAAMYFGKKAGPRVLIRCELDALPIAETIHLPYRSQNAEASHKCGHDGHMSIVGGVAAHLHNQAPQRGSVVLLFQPSEETGEGAAWVIQDPKYAEIQPDYVFALHNLPGYPLGDIILSDGLFASASTGLAIELTGATSHAAEPEKGRSPALAVAQLIEAISSVPQFYTALDKTAQATIIHAEVGEVAFGTSPGQGKVMATLRSHSQEMMDILVEKSTELAKGIAATYGLEITTKLMQPFPVTTNYPEATAIVRKAAHELGMTIHDLEVPFAWSEDFGHFTAKHKGALFGLGSGEKQPALHHPDYDFPDALIERGVGIFLKILQSLVG
jgi:amidohydrolase